MKYLEFNGLRINLHPQVYKPREDSFMLIDGIKESKEFANQDFIEIGIGTGIITLNLMEPETTCISTDINYHAAKLAHENAIRNGYSNLIVVCTDLARCFRSKALASKFIFNPPYLPRDPDIDDLTPSYEVQQLVGGTQGYEVMSKALQNILQKSVRDEELIVGYGIISSLATNPVEFAKLHHEWKVRVTNTLNLGFETIWLVRMEFNEY